MQDRSTQRKVEMQCRGVKDAVQGHQWRNQQVQNVYASVCAHLSISTVHVTGGPGHTEIHGGSNIPWVLKRGPSAELPRQTCSVHPGHLR